MNYVSLFSSAGVGCYGFLQEEYKCLATSELLEKRLAIQKYNNKIDSDIGYVLGDITKTEVKENLYKSIEINKDNNEEVDVIIFTAPCQGMSVANHKKNDGTIEKNSLVVEALEIVKEIQPKIFISENVRSFMNTKCIDHDEEKPIHQAFKDWLGLDYAYLDKTINFKDFGASSSRTRSIVIGVRKDLPFINIDKLFPSKSQPPTLKEVIGHLSSLQHMGEIDENDIFHSFRSYREDMRYWIKDLLPGESAFDNKDPLKVPHRIINGEYIQNKNKNGDKYKRQLWDKVAPCVHTRNDILASQNTIHPIDDRVFSIRELMLMMNIPNSFKWGNYSNEEKINNLTYEEKKVFLKQNELNIRQSIGEAIPTIIISKIAKNIRRFLEIGEEIEQETDRNFKEQMEFTF